MPQINLSKGLAMESPIVGVASHINRFEHPLVLRENQEAKEEEEEEEEEEEKDEEGEENEKENAIKKREGMPWKRLWSP